MWSECCVFLLVTGTSSFVNVAFYQNLERWPSMGAPPQQPEWTDDKTVDGNTSQNYEFGSCAITDINNQNTTIWWKVWLQRKFNIAYLEIYFRLDTFQRSTGFSIYTYSTVDFDKSKHLVYRHDPMSGCPSPIQNVTVNNVTRGILFINERPPGYTSNCQGDNTMYTSIELCEVKVMGCDQNRFSFQCEKTCPNKCNGHCDAFTGSCIHGCSDPEALTKDCIACIDGMYILNGHCAKCQGHCKDGSPCDKLTGRCDQGCANHWNGTFCQKCEDGYYRSDCNRKCGHCLNGESCDKQTGRCTKGCQNHFQPPFCQECEDGYYGNNCVNKCGHCLEKDFCDKITGMCSRGCQPHFLSPLCQVGVKEFSKEEKRVDDKDNGTLYVGLYIVVGILAILLTTSVGVNIHQRRQITALFQTSNLTHSQAHRETNQTNYDNFTALEESHQYSTLDAKREDSHYQEMS